MRTLIIIPAYNEADGIEKVVDNIVQNFPQYDYIVINDGSSDTTRDICRQRGYQYLNLSINLGIGGAVQTGYKYAKDKNYLDNNTNLLYNCVNNQNLENYVI